MQLLEKKSNRRLCFLKSAAIIIIWSFLSLQVCWANGSQLISEDIKREKVSYLSPNVTMNSGDFLNLFLIAVDFLNENNFFAAVKAASVTKIIAGAKVDEKTRDALDEFTGFQDTVKQAWIARTEIDDSYIRPKYIAGIKAGLEAISANVREGKLDLLLGRPVKSPTAGDIISRGEGNDFVLILGVLDNTVYYCELNKDDQGGLNLGNQGKSSKRFFMDRPEVRNVSYVEPTLKITDVSDKAQSEFNKLVTGFQDTVKQAWIARTEIDDSYIRPKYIAGIKAGLEAISANVREGKLDLLLGRPVKSPTAGDIISRGEGNDFVLILGVLDNTVYYCELNKDDQGGLNLGNQGKSSKRFFMDRPEVRNVSYVEPTLKITDVSDEIQKRAAELQKELKKIDAERKNTEKERNSLVAKKRKLENMIIRFKNSVLEVVDNLVVKIKKSVLQEDEEVTKPLLKKLQKFLISSSTNVSKDSSLVDIEAGSFIRFPGNLLVFITEVAKNNFNYFLMDEKIARGSIDKDIAKALGIHEVFFIPSNNLVNKEQEELKEINKELGEIQTALDLLESKEQTAKRELTKARAAGTSVKTIKKPAMKILPKNTEDDFNLTVHQINQSI